MSKSLFYEVTLVVEVTEDHHKGWDAHCDETAGVLFGSAKIGRNVHAADYKGITEEDYLARRYNILDKRGGL